MTLRTDFTFLLLAFCMFPFVGFSQVPKVVKGVLDLRGIDWEKHDEISLNGEWEFYWQEFIASEATKPLKTSKSNYIKVPSSWNNYKVEGKEIGAKGFGSYRTLILIDNEVKDLAIKFIIVSTAYKLFIDGKLVLSAGTTGNSKETTIPNYDPMVSTILEADTIEMVIHVANFDHRLGGVRDSIFIGKESSLFINRGRSLLADLFLAGCFMMMGLYHLVLYLIKKEKSPLYFSVFCIIVTVRLFVTGNIPIGSFIDINWYWLIRIEYLSFYTGSIAFIAFFYSLFRKYMNRHFVLTIYVVQVLMCIPVLTTSPYFFTNLLIVSQAVFLITILYTLIILLKAHQEKNKEAIIFFIGYILLLVFATNDILHANEIIETEHLFPIGFFLFLFTKSILLSRRYALAFKNNDVLLERLNLSNKELESKVEKRTKMFENQKIALMERNGKITLQNKELVKLNKELDNFVYSVSHDLKAPLASMIGLIHLARDENNLETLRHYREMMERSINRQNDFIIDILDYSRNARLPVKRDEIDFEKLLNSTFEQYQFIEQWSEITKQIFVKQKGKFFTDRQRLNIILNNLVSNALRYSTISNNDPKVNVNVVTDKLNANIEIIDNGCGISEEHLEKIFDMFYRADEENSGSGLGLYIVKEALEKLNGSIQVSSEIGKGTTFTISLPSLY